MLSFLSTRNWSRYSRENQDNPEALYKYRRVILMSQFALFGSVVSLLHSLEDIVDGLLFMPAMDIIMGVGVFTGYLINERGHHKTAKIFILTFLNIFFFVYSSLVPVELGIYLYYFPWVALAAVVFEVDENAYKIFFIVLSVLLLVTLFVTGFDAFGADEFQAEDMERSFIINMVSSLAVLSFFIIFMSNMNEQSERMLYDLADEIKKKNIDLEKANKELDRFFYSATHDLKTPVMDIKGIINMAIAEIKEPEVLEHFLLLKERAQKLDDFLKDIIDYARNTKTGMSLSTVSIDWLVNEVIENFRFISGADKIRFEKDFDPELVVETDRVRLYTILNNIISNAVKYHRQDIKNKWIRIKATQHEGNLTIVIMDNGQGIERELIPKIFNMFFRGTDQSKGSGLGLYIVKETIEKLNGQIAVDSELNAGTSVTVIIPANIVQKETNALAKENTIVTVK